MNTKEIRKRILELLYQKRSEDFVEPSFLLKEIDLTDEVMDNEIRYLAEKGYIKMFSEYSGKKFLNFAGIKITAYGIDLVEDPEEFNKLFTVKINNNSFGDLKNSNVNINSDKNKQSASISKGVKRKWYETWLAKIIFGVVIALIAGFFIFKLGWN